MKKVLVTGGRDYSNRGLLFRVLDAAKPTHVVHGGARGADSLAHDWCKSRNVDVSVYPADWTAHGKAAGAIRNAEMLSLNPDIQVCIAFPGDRGTADMVKKARKAKVVVVVVEDKGVTA